MSRVALCAFSDRQNVNPSTPGISMSRTTTSGRKRAIDAAAASASRASTISMSAASNVARSNARSPWSSSTTRIRVRAGLALGSGLPPGPRPYTSTRFFPDQTSPESIRMARGSSSAEATSKTTRSFQVWSVTRMRTGSPSFQRTRRGNS